MRSPLPERLHAITSTSSVSNQDNIQKIEQSNEVKYSSDTIVYDDDQQRLQNCIKDSSHGRTDSLVEIKFHSLFDDINKDESDNLMEEVEELQIKDEIYNVIKKSDLEYLEQQTEDGSTQSDVFTERRRHRFRKTFNLEPLKGLLKLTKKYARKYKHPPNEVATLNRDDDLEETKEVQESDYIPTSHEVFINIDRKHSFFRREPSNFIRSTKYRWWNFIPKNLFEQFLRLSNIYFLITMIVSLIPGISPIFPITSIIPLALILLLTALKDAIEDLVSKFEYN
jgi:hypothetical protein